MPTTPCSCGSDARSSAKRRRSSHERSSTSGPTLPSFRLRDGAPSPATRIEGEVWEIDDSALRELDAFEGYPELYTRERIALRVAEPEARDVDAFVYVLARRPPARARVIATGRYAAAGTALPEGAAPDQFEANEAPRQRRQRR